MEKSIEKRTLKSNRHFEIYLQYVKMYKVLKLKWTIQRGYTSEIQNIWTDMTRKLNDCGGPVRDVTHWKKVFTEWKSHTRRKLKFNRPLNDIEKQLVELTGITGNPERKKIFAKELKNKCVSGNNISIKQEDPEIKEEIEEESDTSFTETEKKPIERTIETHVKGNRKIIISEKQPKTKVPDKPLEERSNDQNKAQDNQLKPETPSTVLNDLNLLRPRLSDASSQIDSSFLGISSSDIVSVSAALLSLSNSINRYCDIVERRIF